MPAPASVRVFRLVSLLEGFSYLILVLFAMPIKYGAGDPSWVRLFGRAHGALFVAFVGALTVAAQEAGWDRRRVGEFFGLSLVPFGAFVIERRLEADASGAPRGGAEG